MYSNINYNNPGWLNTLAGSKITGAVSLATTVTNGVYITDVGTVSNNMLAGGINNSKLSSSTVSLVAGTGIGITQPTVSLGGSTTISNVGVTSINAGTGTNISSSTGSVTIWSSIIGVNSISAGTATVVTTSTGSITVYSQIATTSTFGVIKVGNGLSIDGSGVVSTSEVQTIRNAGAVNILTIDFNTDEIVTIQPTGTLTITLQNYKAGKVVRLYILLNSARGINLGVNGQINTNVGTVNIPSSAIKNAPQTVFVNYSCLSTLAQDCFAQVLQ